MGKILILWKYFCKKEMIRQKKLQHLACHFDIYTPLRCLKRLNLKKIL